MNQHLERIDTCAALIREPVRELLSLCESKLHSILLVVYGWRSVAEQALLYQKGRAVNRETGEWEIVDTSLVVTKAKPGATAHNVITRDGQPASMAVDLIPLLADGTANWESGEAFWDDLYRLAWQVGLDPLGDPVGAYLKYDKGHFEEPGWKLKLAGLNLMQPVDSVQA